MRSKYIIILSFLLGLSTLNAALTIYPESGGLNPRVPVVKPTDCGAKGKGISFDGVTFTYNLAPHLQTAAEGELSFNFRINPNRRERTIIKLSDKAGKTIGFTISAASQGRKAILFSNKKEERGKSFSINEAEKWQKGKLSWTPKEVSLELAGNKLSLPLTNEFTVEKLSCLSWSTDELVLKSGDSEFLLDWENGYAGKLTPGKSGGISLNPMGFDTFVIGNNPKGRDFPVLQLNNSTSSAKDIEVSFSIMSEQNAVKQEWKNSLNVPAGKSLEQAIKFPFPLKSDIYHLTIKSKDAGAEYKKHFMYVTPYSGKRGPGLFGLHDCDVRDFGFWPDALPLRYSHKYLYWGYVFGPAWEKDWNGSYGMDPNTPPYEWNWNYKIDWLANAGHDMYVCLQSHPLGDWYRARPYPKMKKYPWGYAGGFPKLDRYEQFVSESVKHYKGKVKRWEVENEPNASGHMPKQPEDYAKIAQTVKKAVKAVDPNSIIYGICGTSTFIPWMKKALKAGAADALDRISWHTYTTPKQPDEAGLVQMLAEAAKAVPKNKELFNSETGILSALRYKAENPIPAEEVETRIKEGAVGFVSASSWPGKVNNEWQASSSIVKNAVINFLAGVKGFIFFGWNPQWPKKAANWTNYRPGFSILSASLNGERTPSLYTLAVGVLCNQMAGVDLNKPYRSIDNGTVRGGIFSTVDGKEVAILWSTTPQTTALLKTPKGKVQAVSIFGQSNELTAPDYITLQLTTMPTYIHYAGKGLALLPSPVEKIETENITDGKGTVTFTLLNRADKDWNAQISAEPVSSLKVTPANATVNIRPKRRSNLRFTVCMNSNIEKEFWIPFKVLLPSGGTITQSVKISSRAILKSPLLPSEMKEPTPDTMAKYVKTLNLDKVEQLTMGRPTNLASLQEDYFWNGKEELSAQAWLAHSKEKLFVVIKVRDQNAVYPKWPGINGSCVELFLDFRTPGKGLGEAYYGNNVYQFLLRPILKEGDKVQVFCPQLHDLKKSGIQARGGKLNAGSYWIAFELPWKFINKQGTVPARFGFDIGVDGSYPDKAKRKSQLMMFGGAQNARNASEFITVTTGK